MFITFEGPEGGGKSTAIRSLAAHLEGHGHSVLTTREPGSGDVGRAIREILLHGSALSPRCELFLFLADRAQHVSTIVRPALHEGKIVISDRFADSTVVYQGVARGLDRERAISLNAFAADNLVPDLTLLLDLLPEVGLARIKEKDRLDSESLEFHHAVRNGFLKEAEADPDRWVVIDASRPPEEVSSDVIRAVDARLKRKSGPQ